MELDKNLAPLEEKYEFQGKLGSGAMGVIYKARHKVLSQTVAIKLMNRNIVSPDAIRRFKVEGQATSKLSHPNIIAVHDFGTIGGHPYLVMEYVEGKTMADAIAADGQLQVDRLLDICEQICLGLSHAHDCSIIHRDIKPSNIMLIGPNDDEVVKIMDFGIAKMLMDPESLSQDWTKMDLTKTGETVGSPTYMSPEQVRGKNVDARSDLYSLGCVMFEALAGSPPFLGKTIMETMRMQLSQQPVSLKVASLGKDFDLQLEILVRRLLDKVPDARFASAEEVRQAIKQIPRSNPRRQVSAVPVSAHNITKIQGVGAERASQVSSIWSASKYKIPLGIAAIVALVGAVIALMMQHRVSHNAATTERQSDSLNSSVSPNASAASLTQTNSTSSRLSPPQSTGSQSESANSPSKTAPNAVSFSESSSGGLKEFSDFDIAVGLPTIGESDKAHSGQDGGMSMKGMVQEILRNHGARVDLDRALMREQLRDEDLAPLKEATFTRHIVLKDCPLISDKGLAFLEALPLDFLDISGTRVRTLVHLKAMTTLRDLYVGNTAVDKNALAVIRGLVNLTSLDLSNTSIQDRDLSTLKGLTKLRSLDLTECPLSEAAVHSLKTSLPQCKISFYRTKTTGKKGHKVPDLMKDAIELEEIGQWQAARDKWQDARDTMEEIGGDKASIARCYQGEGECLVQSKLYRQGIQSLNRSMQILPLRGNDPRRAGIFQKIAEAEEGLREYDKAVPYRRQAGTIYEAINSSGSGTASASDPFTNPNSSSAAVRSIENWIMLASDYKSLKDVPSMNQALGKAKEVVAHLQKDEVPQAERLLKALSGNDSTKQTAKPMTPISSNHLPAEILDFLHSQNSRLNEIHHQDHLQPRL